MNIWHIAAKEIKRDFRDVRTFIFMLAFPIVLMLILGSALSNAFNSTIEIGEMKVLYKDTSSGPFSPYFESFAKEAGKSGIQFERAAAEVDGVKEVEDNRYTSYLEITGQGVRLYGSPKSSIESNIVQGVLSTFVDQYNVATEVAKVDPKAAAAVFGTPGTNKYIQETALNSARQPGAMDYYAVTMTTMIALYGAMSASFLVQGERNRRTGDRLLAAPISKAEIFIGKVLGSMITNSFCLLIVVLFSKYAFHAYWGDNIFQVIPVLATEVLLAVSFGLGVSYMAGGAARMVVLVVVQVASFLGGAYFPTDNAEGIGNLVTHFSPLRWANDAMTQIIYANDFSAAIPAISLNVVLAALFLLVASVSMRRREGL